MKKQRGVTLVEVLLVLVIGGMLLYLSMKQYFMWQDQGYRETIRENVDSLFQAMSNYYRANCSSYANYSVTPSSPGLLSARTIQPFNGLVPVNINTLQTSGYLTQPLAVNRMIVAVAGQGTQGFVAQFNLVRGTPPRTICTSTGCATSTNVGNTMVWQAQIAVHINARTQAEATAYGYYLGADCMSSYAGNVVAPCQPGSTGFYAVWKRAPSFTTSNPNARSPLWVSTPTVNQFTQMYTTYPVNSLTNGTQTNTQFYECGN